MPAAQPINGFEPPPSSILATHVVHGNGVPDFDRGHFNLLLAEALGSDEQGQPNLGADPSVNHKLICIVFQIGIEPALDENPFGATTIGTGESQLRTCLEVLQVAIERSPPVIFVKSDRQGNDVSRKACALYTWLIPTLLPLIASSQASDIGDAVLCLFESMVGAGTKCAPLSCSNVVLAFLRNSISGQYACRPLFFRPLIVPAILSVLESLSPVEPDKRVVIDSEDFALHATKATHNLDISVPSLKFSSCDQLLLSLARGLKLVSEHSTDPQSKIQFRKALSQLSRFVDDSEHPDHNVAQPEVRSNCQHHVSTLITRQDLSHEIRSLSIRPLKSPVKSATSHADTWPDSDRARKRPRLSTEHEDGPLTDTTQQKICRRLTFELTGRAVPDLDGLNQTASVNFRRLSEDNQCAVLELIGITACQLASNSLDPHCPHCDDVIGMRNTSTLSVSRSCGELLKTLLVLIQSISRPSRARIIAMTSLRAVIAHTELAENLKLGNTPAGDWCLQSLKSSSRDLRIVASKTLQAYVTPKPHTDISLIRDNRILALDLLHTLWEKGEMPVQETVVMALAQMATVVGDEELNIILIRLVEYLGHTNPYIGGLVYAEIQNLTQSLQTTVWLLFRPYWRTLGVVFAKSLMSRSNVANQLCELLSMEMSSLMGYASEYALPYLVLHKAHDVIKKFADANGQSTTPFELCTQQTNLVAIVSFLLVQPFADAEQNIMSILSEVSEEFGKTDLANWVALEPIQIACELLKAIGDSGQGKSSRIYQALQLLAQLVARQRGQASASRRSDSMGTFLESNVLAIVTHFTVLLIDWEAKESNVEKRRCLAALGEVVKLGKSRIVRGLPQICACLRSGLEDINLCNAAFVSWVAMIRSLKKDDLEPLIDQTLAIIVRSWDILDNMSQQLAFKIVTEILRKHSDLVKENFSTMPSLASIPLMAEHEETIASFKQWMDERQQLMAYVRRLQDENVTVVEQALIELAPLLQQKQDSLQRAILREQPDEFVANLTRALLDCCVKFNSSNEISRLCGQCLGNIGCLDASKVDSVRERNTMVVLSNFGKAGEVIRWIFFFLEHVLVKAFLSANTTRAQGFLGWAMQMYLKACELEPSDNGDNLARQLWDELPASIQNVLTPFLTSKYTVQEVRAPEKSQYPLFGPGMRHRDWLRTITLDFLHRGSGENVVIVFPIACRIIHGQDASIPAFLLPYAVVNIIVNGIEQDSQDIAMEMNTILSQSLDGHDRRVQDDIKLCSQTIFEVLDYMSTWHQQKRKQYNSLAPKADRGLNDTVLASAAAQISSIEQVLEQIAPDVLAQRALECRSYSRALFHWEQHIRKSTEEDVQAELQRLQDIYAQIDEPDGIEGISTRMHVLDIDQQILEHKKAGRWTAAQGWYEMELVANPDNTDAQKNLMECLKEIGQYDALIHHCEDIRSRSHNSTTILAPYAVEAAWSTNRWELLATYLPKSGGNDFPSYIAEILLALKEGNGTRALELISEAYRTTASDLNQSNTSSFGASHDTLLKLHALNDVQIVATCHDKDHAAVLNTLRGRLDVLGSNVADKQYLLGLRRAVMSLRPQVYSSSDIAAAWLTSAKLARKARSTTQAFSAVLKASVLGDKSAAIEQAKIMWSEGQHRKAIQTLEGAIESRAFITHEYTAENGSTTMTVDQHRSQNEMAAKAHVLLGKWLAHAGQTQSEVIRMTFRTATENFSRGEQGWYHLGRYYNKMLDSERAMPPGKESQTYLTGETSKHVIENYMRSLLCGSKYVFQTLPKVLTLWFELVDGAELSRDDRRGNSDFQAKVANQRKRIIEETRNQIQKYVERLQPVLLYTILPQVVARICHANKSVYDTLSTIVIRVVRAFPQQAFWTLLAVVESQQKDRALKGINIVNKLIESTKKSSKDSSAAAELRSLFSNGQKFVKELLRISEFPIEAKVNTVHLARDLGFNHKIAPSKLVIPNQTCLIPSMPTSFEPAQLKAFRPFAREPVTIAGFEDEALVLSSLQKPRKLTIRGSDGNTYNVLAKPKDDLRKDQRLMEFNNMINRFLKRDVDAAKRRLYIRTYAVIPLNEECGLIEWVDNLKTFRDIIIKLYKDKSISPNYGEIRNLLDDASSAPSKTKIFSEKVLSKFPPVFHDWFVESFPDPSAWFNARLRYTRTAAVMSIVGHVLGLGDRHGENILFEEDNGGTLHVDFNCLFDKGLTFDKPEMVPFRLTHNMVDAMGTYGYEGPFRRSSEITLQLLRGNEDALMTILEAFLHDPTTDFINSGNKKKKVVPGAPNTPVEVLEGVRGKVRGFLSGESVPLSVGGYVDEMIGRATDHRNLCRMYIGWCSFF